MLHSVQSATESESRHRIKDEELERMVSTLEVRGRSIQAAEERGEVVPTSTPGQSDIMGPRRHSEADENRRSIDYNS